MEFDLSRMNGSSFEHLVRALSFAIFGQAGVVYSAGADGGRDFTIEGVIPGYESRSWNGYLVVQAKCKHNTGRDDDIDWVKNQIAREIAKYKRNSSLRRPKYYILATNVKLSGADGIQKKSSKKATIGGMSKILAQADNLKSDLGVEDYDIWPADKISDFLLAHDSIRRSYRGWVTSGDVLAKVLGELDNITPSFKSVVGRALKVNLEQDQYVRLRDAGSVEDIRIRTSQVFVDLPLLSEKADYRTGLPQQESCVSKLMMRCSDKLDADSMSVENSSQDDKRPRPNRVVVIGGPGQGKSTATLFFSQILRANIISADPTSKRNDNVKFLYPEILSRSKHESITPHVALRYPIHILLPRFADAISRARVTGGKTPSLLAFIADEFASASDTTVERHDVREWLASYPWALILDGLDEVPPSGERPSLLDAINNFFTEVAEINADVLVVVTTRPQGFNKDLSPNLWEYWTLAELNVDQALSYAKAFGLARYPLDKRRREDVLHQLKDATVKPATSRLLVSPLQVTILHFIVDTGGGVPAARWTLFNEYFETLKKREKAKGGKTKDIIEKYWSQLGPIHYRAGLVLQADSEHGGNAASKFTAQRFKELVRSYLLSEGFRADEVELHVADIMQLALHRLVLLSSQEENHISFDVRSLQEYMAAAAITSGDQPTMEKRLSFIAGRAHWRHVFLIAASRCFADDSYHYRRSIIVTIPRQIDALKPDSLTSNGSRLALDLVADGIGLEHPLTRRPLLYHSVELLSLGPSNYDERLGTIWDESNIDILEEVLRRSIIDNYNPSAFAAWRLLFHMLANHAEWAEKLIIEFWPQDPITGTKVLSQLEGQINSKRLYSKVIETLTRAGCEAILENSLHRSDRLIGLSNGFSDEERDIFNALSLSYDFYRRDEEYAKLYLQGKSSDVSVSVTSLDSQQRYSTFGGLNVNSVLWLPMIVCLEVSKSLTLETVAHALEKLAEADFRLVMRACHLMPWVLTALIAECRSSNEFLDLAQQVRLGKRGHPEDWRAAEVRWLTDGINGADVAASVARKQWLHSDIGSIGTPPFIGNRLSASESNAKTAAELAKIIISSEPSQITLHSANLVGFILSPFGVKEKISNIEEGDIILSVLLNMSEKKFYCDILTNFDPSILSHPEMEASIGQFFEKAVVSEYSRNDMGEFAGLYIATRQKNFLKFAVISSKGVNVKKIKETFSVIPRKDVLEMIEDPGLSSYGLIIDSIQAPSPDNARYLATLHGQTTDINLRKTIVYLLSTNIFPLHARTMALTQIAEGESRLMSGESGSCLDSLKRVLDARPSHIGIHKNWIDELLLFTDAFSILLPQPDVRAD